MSIFKEVISYKKYSKKTRFNEKIVKSFKTSIEILSNLLQLYLLVFYICLIQIAKEIFQFTKKA